MVRCIIFFTNITVLHGIYLWIQSKRVKDYLSKNSYTYNNVITKLMSKSVRRGSNATDSKSPKAKPIEPASDARLSGVQIAVREPTDGVSITSPVGMDKVEI